MQSNDPAAIKLIPDLCYKTVDGIDLYLDIAQPVLQPEEPLPLVIYIHGGAWLYGDRKGADDHFLARFGFITASIEYRFSNQAIFPAQIEDVQDAVRWLRAHAASYHIDPDRIGVWGHSAGGHLAALLGTTGGVQEFTSVAAPISSRVQAVVDLSGPTDLTQMGGTHDDPDSPEALLLGGPVKERIKQARQANPMSYVHSELPPFLIIHGVEDTVVPCSQSQLLYQTLKQAQADVSFVPVAGENHIFAQLGPASMQHVLQLTHEFFAKYLQPN